MNVATIDTSKAIFTTGEVAALCGVAAATVAKWHTAGHIKAYRLPTGLRARRFVRADLIAFMQRYGMDTTVFHETRHAS